MNNKNNSSRRRLIIVLLELSLIVAVVIAGYLIITNKQQLVDWWRLKNYSPPANIAALADETTMTAQARRDFYASEPSIEDRVNFNQSCSVKEHTIVLGCYVSGDQKIYIFQVTDQKLNGVEQVTAAHETLHAIYDRLSDNERKSIDKMLEAQMKKLSTDSHLQQLISLYNAQEPGELFNEMHSILGTEYGHLSPQLEHYYAQYFTNRQAIVDYANGYKGVFAQMQQQITQDETLLRDLKQNIDNLGAMIERQKAQLSAQQSELKSLRSSDPASYNARVPVYNKLVNDYNGNVSQYRNLIDQYNSIVKDHNNIAIEFNDLNNELDSQYQPIH